MKITGLRFYSIVFLLVMISLKASAQLPVPVIECVSFLDETTLRVTWSVTPDPLNDFDGFRIQPYSVNNPGAIFGAEIIPDKALRSWDFPISTPGGPAPDQYKIEIYTFKASPFELSMSSVPRYSIFLEFGASTNEGKAVLNWGQHQSLDGSFTILRRTETGTFETIGSTTNEYSYEDIITAPYCDPTPLYYQVEYSSSLGSCSANSSVALRLFADETYPEDPILNLVTIKDEKAEVHWINSTSDDVASYIIEMLNSAGTWDELATVDFTTNPYLDDAPNRDPCEDIYTYVVRAEDECGLESPGAINYLNPHNTIHLRVETESNCGRKATLTWNAYKNMTPPVSQYKIFRGEYLVSQNEVEIGHVDASGDTQYSFTDETLLPSNDYVYYVRAVNADPTYDDIRSESCRIPVAIDYQVPDEFELDYLTVVEDEYINLNINGIPADIIHSVEIYRSDADAASLELLATIEWGGFSPFIISEILAEVNETAYYYQIAALDACGFELARTAVSKSIYLTLMDHGNGNIRLDWNAYEGWGPGELEGYAFYRLENGVEAAGFPKPPTSDLFYNDVTTGTEAGAVTYYVEALRTDGTTSRSNEVLLPAEAIVTVPNAFRPGSLDVEANREFKPSVTNIEPDSYLFAIYNRWGQLVFETNDPALGWNGQIKGREALRDIYAWVISYTDLTGIKASKRGSVILIR